MASTAYRRVASFSASGYNVNLESRTTASFSRTNNTLSVSGAKVDVRFANDSAAILFSGFNIVGSYSLPQGTDRRSNYGLGSDQWNRGETRSTPAQSFTVTVGKDATSITTNNGAGVNSASWGGGQSFSIPTAGSPTGQTINATDVSVVTVTLNAAISNWGTNCTAGSGQRIEYREGTSGAWTELAYSTSMSHSRNVTGLKPSTLYQMRTYTSNGAGQTGYSSISTFTTLPAPSTSAPLLKIIGVIP